LCAFCRSYIVQEELKQEQVGIQTPSLGLEDNQAYAQDGQTIISNEVNRFLTATYPRLPLEAVESIQSYLLSDETLASISKSLGIRFFGL